MKEREVRKRLDEERERWRDGIERMTLSRIEYSKDDFERRVLL